VRMALSLTFALEQARLSVEIIDFGIPTCGE
jgi:hypothetical protein